MAAPRWAQAETRPVAGRTHDRRPAATPGRATPIVNAQALKPFFQALDRLRSKKPTTGGDVPVVRAMQLGDSHTAADLWTGRVRAHLQERFGNAGVGIVMPARPWRGYAHAGVREAFDPVWPATSLRSPSSSEGWVGLTGGALRVPSDATYRLTGEFRWFEVLSLAVPGQTPELAPRPAPRRSAGPDGGIDADGGAPGVGSPMRDAGWAHDAGGLPPPVVTMSPGLARPQLALRRPSSPPPPPDAATPGLATPHTEYAPLPPLNPTHTTEPLADGRVLHVLSQSLNAVSGPVELSIALPQNTWLLGVELRTGTAGVLYDELGLNGAELFDLDRWQRDLRQRLLSRAHPHLIVVAYGTNEMGRRDLDGAAYRERASALLRQLRDETGASVLVVGPPDRGAASARRARTLRDAAKLITDALKDAASETGCAFWSAGSAMGGAGTMSRWKTLGLARADLVHLNAAGYERLGDLQFEALMAAYERHRRTHR